MNHKYNQSCDGSLLEMYRWTKKIAHQVKYRTSNKTKVPYSRLSLEGHLYKTDTSVKQTPRVGPCCLHCSLYLTLYRTDITLRPTLSAFPKVSVLERIHCIHRLFVSSLTFKFVYHVHQHKDTASKEWESRPRAS